MIPVLITLIHNAALLLAMMVVFDLVTSRKSVYGQRWRQALAGVILGALCISLMMASFRLENGIIFDTRSVLLSLSGLFLGFIPTLFVMAIAAVYRLWQGGAGVWTGIWVILATGGVGILWRYYRQGHLKNISVRELYGFGVVVHLVMLTLMLTLPWETAQRVLSSIGLPVLLVYPIATIALGWLLASRLQRENATAALMRSEQRFRQLFEVAPVPLVLTDQEGTLTLVNDRWEQAFGYTRKEIPAIKNWWPLAYPDPEYRRLVIDSWEAAVRHARESDNDTVELQDYRITCKNGDVRTIEITGAFIEEELLVAFFDITERQQSQLKLAESEALLSRSQEMAHIGSWSLDLITNNLYWSDEVYRIVGCEPQEFDATYEDFLGFIHPDDRAAVEEAYSRSVREGRDNYEIEHRIVRQGTGEIRQVYERCVHICDEVGAIVQSIGMVQDITERKVVEADQQRLFEQVEHDRRALVSMLEDQRKTEMSLRESEERLRISETRYRSVIAVSNTGAWEFHHKEKYLWCSPEYFEMLGRNPDDYPMDGTLTLEKSWTNLIHPDDRQSAVDDFTNYLDGGSIGMYENIFRMSHANGSWVSIWSRGQTIRNIDGSVSDCTVGTHIDITERKQAQDLLKQQKTQLQQRNRALRQFNYAVSHELKTPLVSIESSLGLIQSTLLQTTDPEAISAFGYARHATRQMNNLLESLLLMFRIDAADTDTETTPFGVLVQDAIDQLIRENRLKGINVAIPARGPELCGDRHKLVQIWLQLIENAAKYMGDQKHPAIDIGAEQINQEIQFFVRDNGKGIEKSYHEKIFGLFDRLDKAVDGTGLGLTLVQRIVEYYGGTIRVESAGAGQGSCFYFTLPDVLNLKDTRS